MRGSYDLWLISCSYLVAVAASYAALELAGRIVVAQGRAAWAWLAGGSAAMGLGIWSMHFIGMLAFHLPIALTYDVPVTLLSVVPAILSAALVLALMRSGALSGLRLAAAAILLGSGIAAMHYTGMAAIPIQPGIRYDATIFAASVAVAIAVAFVALRLAFSLSGTASRWTKLGAALVMAGGICAMHYTGMAAAVFAPDSICTVPADAINNTWLAAIIAFNTVIVLLVTVGIAFYDARLSDRNAGMVEALKAANLELSERTHRAEGLTSQLRSSEESLRQFRVAMETSPDAIFLVDRASMRYIDVNDTACTMLGYSRGELLQMGPVDVNAHATREEMQSAFDKAITLGSPAHPTTERRALRRKDGTIFPIEVRRTALRSGDRNIIVAVAQDITNREQAEAQIIRTREQLRLALVGSKLALFEWDVPTGEIFLSERWAEITGGKPGATQTTIDAFSQSVHPQDADQVRATITSMIKGDTPFFGAEYRVMTASGDYVWVQSHGKVERDSAGRAVRVSGTNADIGERKRSEQELKVAHDKLGDGVRALEQRNREITVLAELSNFLLSCVTVEEACTAIPRYADMLFPEELGAVYLLRASRDYLTVHASWGGRAKEYPSFKPEDCWALRLGRVHAVSDPARDPICAHATPVHGEALSPYLCVPMIVQSDLIGLVWIAFGPDTPLSGERDSGQYGKRQLAVSLSEQIALALSNIRLRDNLRQQTIRDPLTGLFNRRFLEESLNREMARCKRKAGTFAVFMIDVDHFKRFNDTYGHDAGDGALRAISEALEKSTREGDIVCRFGGEEFVVVLPDTNLDGASVRAQRILEFVRGLEIVHNGRTLRKITVSIGLAMFPGNGDTVQAIVQSADKALYEAKGAGRDRMIVAERNG